MAKKERKRAHRKNISVKFNHENIASLEVIEEGLNILDEDTTNKEEKVEIVEEVPLIEVEVYKINYTPIGIDMAQFITRSINNKIYKDNYKKISILPYCKEFNKTYFNLTEEGSLMSRDRGDDKNCVVTISKFNILMQIHTEIESQIRNTRSVETNIIWLDKSCNLIILIQVKPFFYMNKMGFTCDNSIDKIIASV